jgi:hypothetical protein
MQSDLDQKEIDGFFDLKISLDLQRSGFRAAREALCCAFSVRLFIHTSAQIDR